nr:hypothetical protein [Butyricicoccus sp. GAM44]
MNHELNKNDSQLLEVNLLNQLKLAKRVNLFDYSLEKYNCRLIEKLYRIMDEVNQDRKDCD